jgi:hypothetical protein
MYYFFIENNGLTGFYNSDANVHEGSIEAPETFKPEEFDTWTLVDGVPMQDPAALLAITKLRKLKEVRQKYDGIMQGIKASVASYEVLTWDTQRNELTAFLANPANPTPYVDSLAAARGETRDVLFTKIKAKVDGMAYLQGQQHALEKQVEAATTLEQLQALEI